MAEIPATLAADVDAFFAPGGRLSRALPAYEARPAQREVAAAVVAALRTGELLLAEAGTGCGKSMAYLVPAVLSGLRVVVATNTKNLQDQLLAEDVPLLQRALGRRLAVETIKGRGNYLCERRAELAFAQGMLPGLPDAAQWARLRAWRSQTHRGDRAELAELGDHAPMWRELSASAEQCSGRHCRDFERCWVTEARRRASHAEVIVANHALYLADAALRRAAPGEHTGLLPPHDVVIFDEAHELADCAAQHFGCQISERRVADLAADLAAVAAAQPGVAAAVLGPAGALPRAAHALFAALPFAEERRRIEPGQSLGAAGEDALLQLDAALAQAEAALGRHADEAVAHLGRRAAQLAGELAFALGRPPRPGLARQLVLPDAARTDYVHFLEAEGRHLALAARPVDVAPLLGPMFKERATILMSATLRAGSHFDHFRRDVGIGAHQALAVDSPFDYPAQVCLYLPEAMLEPDAPGAGARACAEVTALIAAAGGGTFVLCTSHRALGPMAAAARAAGVGPVWVQGERPKATLTALFRARHDAVLVGTQSFWKGVDVPGPALRLVIIDRIPFAAPGDPLVEARLALCAARGQDPFIAHQVPQAALRLRQGFGRLVRRADDGGMVALLDRRLVSRRYGPLLLRGLPPCPRLTTRAAAVAALRAGRPQAPPAAAPSALRC